MAFEFWAKRVALYRWQKAHSHLAKGAYGEAVKVFEHLEMPDGAKQIILLQYADALYRLGAYEKALEKYLEAKETELRWGARTNRLNSEYIIGYAELYAEATAQTIQSDPNRSFDWMGSRIKKLSGISASKRLKELRLPLPKF